MTLTSKAFAYFFNALSEDHKAARVLSGRHPDTEFSLLSLDGFNSDTHTKLQAVATAFFNASHSLTTPQYNVNGRVLENTCHLPAVSLLSLKRLKEEGLVVTHLEACVIRQGHSINDLLPSSSHLVSNTKTSLAQNPFDDQDGSSNVTKHPIFL
jgi:hypothetical protein